MLKQMTVSDPGFISPHSYLSTIYEMELDCPNYLHEARLTAQLMNDPAQIAQMTAESRAFAAGGCHRMLLALETSRRRDLASGKSNAITLADIQSQLGKKEEALRTLREGVTRHDASIIYMRSQATLRSLHGEPKFQKLLAEIGLPPVTAANP